MSNAFNLSKLHSLAAHVANLISLSGNRTAIEATASAGTPVKIGYAELTGTVTPLAVIPFDSTIPQITEGTEILTLSFTPKFASSDLLIEVEFNGGEYLNNGDYITGALFQDAIADALAVGVIASTSRGSSAITEGSARITYKVAAGSTTARTYRLRAGADTGTNAHINSNYLAATLGGLLKTTMKVTEILT